MANPQHFKVSTSGQMSLPASARKRWGLEHGGEVEVMDLGFGVLTVPAGGSAALLDALLPAGDHIANVEAMDDPDLVVT